MTMTERVMRIMVKRRYFPNSGTASEVGGMISAKRRKNTVSERRMEIHLYYFMNEKDFLSFQLHNYVSQSYIHSIL